MTALTFSKIQKAAVQQHWHVERTGRNHRKLIPPDKSQPIVYTSGTPGDYRVIHNFLAEMRRAGFVWPWPPPNYEKHTQNGATQSTVSVVTADVNSLCGGTRMGVVSMEQIDAEVHDELEREDVTSVLEDVTPEQLNGAARSAVDPPEVTIDDDGAQWRRVLTPARLVINDGYTISDTGACKSPSGKLLKAGLVGNQIYVSLQRPNGRSVSMRLDKLVLWSFVGDPGDDEIETPVHCDRNAKNSVLTNLRWQLKSEEPADVRSKPAKRRRRKSSSKLATQVKNAKTAVVKHERPIDDGVSVALVFTSEDVTLQFSKGKWSITPCEELSSSQVAALGRMIHRWESVRDVPSL